MPLEVCHSCWVTTCENFATKLFIQHLGSGYLSTNLAIVWGFMWKTRRRSFLWPSHPQTQRNIPIKVHGYSVLSDYFPLLGFAGWGLYPHKALSSQKARAVCLSFSCWYPAQNHIISEYLLNGQMYLSLPTTISLFSFTYFAFNGRNIVLIFYNEMAHALQEVRNTYLKRKTGHDIVQSKQK